MDDLAQFLQQLQKMLSVPDFLIPLSLFMLGVILKYTNKVNNDWIPLILTGLGVPASILLLPPAASGFLKGLCYSGVAVLAYEIGLKYVVIKLESVFSKWANDGNAQPQQPQIPPTK